MVVMRVDGQARILNGTPFKQVFEELRIHLPRTHLFRVMTEMIPVLLIGSLGRTKTS